MPTKRQLLNSNHLKSPIKHVCSRCGIIANHYTCLNRYLAPAKKPSFSISTYHTGSCDFCECFTQITEVRDFYYPDFGLVPKAVKSRLIAINTGELLANQKPQYGHAV